MMEMPLGYRRYPCWQNIAGLTELTGLYLSYTELPESPLYDQTSCLDPLSGLTKLTTLYVMNNANLIGHLDALVTLVALKNVHLCNNGTLDISGLSALMAVETLNLRGNWVVDVSALDGLPNLTTLNLSDNWLAGAPYWTDLPSLEKLYAQWPMNTLCVLASLDQVTRRGDTEMRSA